ncbi:MAG: aminoacyl-tRNA hydrolase [Pseudomonadales bacterium]|jgi:PTH1 family peptidyl-tRNA hydrolase|nr:aminoacyl-tRNA hydrolase [Pseudomonadales bacterium]HJN53074.1 aminoacyl-tRNA hydrolase [Pseudomonadales bacterium]|tara:strand:- start:1194 stop:1793 length:600 start_codon:yes stop_codon:yes gene_type:complete
MAEALQLIVGLGNPGAKYHNTRHNVGARFVSGLAQLESAQFKPERKFFGLASRVMMEGSEIRFLLPTTFMNESGRSVSAMVRFYKIPTSAILIAHDELDMPPGTVRFKQGGGHGGHKGLRDIIAALGGDKGFNRLRIGIGHPGSSDQVLNYVLGRAAMSDVALTNTGLEDALEALPFALAGEWQKAMNLLHASRSIEEE